MVEKKTPSILGRFFYHLKSCDVLQVVERLEADLGVTVQEVHFPELRYSFQIWSTYMGLPDKEGNVGPPANLIHDSTEQLLDRDE